MLWKIHYGDGSTFSSDDGSTQEAPPLNVQIIMQLDEREGKHATTQFDYYWWDERQQRWFGGNLFGALDYLMQAGIVKMGRILSPKDYDAILNRAKEDPDFPKSAAWRTDRGQH